MDQNRNGEGRVPASADQKKKWRWGLLSVLIAALTVWAVISQRKGFSLRALAQALSGAKPGWMLLAVLAMLGFVYFEGCALRSACLALHYPTTRRAGFIYAAADIYFSAITPSASGGQPACALMMRRFGIPGSVAAAILMLTLTMYALAILVVGALVLFFAPSTFLLFGPLGRVLIAAGTAIQVGLLAVFVLLMYREGLFKRICLGLLRALTALRLVRHPEKLAARLERTMDAYHQRAALLTGHRPLLLRSFLYNLLQRVSAISVSMFVFLALGGPLRAAPGIFAVQSFVVLGSNCVPIPGAMGVADYLMLDGFQAFLSPDRVVIMELISRSVSFYSCVLLCGLLVLFTSLRKRKAGPV